MKQITDRGGYPNVFYLYRVDYGLWLNDGWAGPDGRWLGIDEFVFRSRKLKNIS